MVLAASIIPCYAVSVRPTIPSSRNFYLLPPLSLIRNPIQQHQPHLAGAYSAGSFLSINGVKLRQSSFAAVIGDTTAVSDGAVNEEMPTIKLSDSVTSQETDMENEEDREDTSEGLDENKMIRVCDKLIEVFLVDKPTPTDWRRLLAFSREWDNIRPHFYKRCQDRADSESDPGIKHKFLRLQRKLREVDDDVQRHNELLEALRKSPSKVADIVSRRRKDFTKEFFVHLHTVAESYYNDPAEQNAVAKVGNMCLEAVEGYDAASESKEALDAAELKFQDIINSPSVDAACKKIDELAQKDQLDPALVLMIGKAWSAAKETDMTRHEVSGEVWHLVLNIKWCMSTSTSYLHSIGKASPYQIWYLEHIIFWVVRKESSAPIFEEKKYMGIKLKDNCISWLNFGAKPCWTFSVHYMTCKCTYLFGCTIKQHLVVSRR